MDMVTQARLRLIFVCSPGTPDWETSRADARAALNLALGVDPADISSLGYAHTPEAYVSVRESWVHHIEQFGHNADFEDTSHWLATSRGYWEEARPDLVTDDWLSAGTAAHLARNPDGCDSQIRGGCTLHEDLTQS